jgi:GMP synthase (glutamine-hydrolysing)
MGGPMSVYAQDRYPHLTDELRLIQKTVGEGAPVLGICLGSQLMAEALGGKVAKDKSKEIGWYLTRLSACASKDPIFSALPQEFMAFHWHGDVFTLPPGAEPLASSELTPLQAFRYGRGAYAILFHLEVTPAGIQGMLDTFAEEIGQEGLSAEDIQRAVDKYAAATSSLGAGVFEGWTNLVLRAASSSR